MPQTRFVLRKAFEHGLPALVMINKADRPDARPVEVLEEVFDLFVELGADDHQLDFPVIYGSGRDGWATDEAGELGEDLEPLFEMILREVPPPKLDEKGPLLFQASTLDQDDFLGRIAIGRVTRGVLKREIIEPIAPAAGICAAISGESPSPICNCNGRTKTSAPIETR